MGIWTARNWEVHWFCTVRRCHFSIMASILPVTAWGQPLGIVADWVLGSVFAGKKNWEVHWSAWPSPETARRRGGAVAIRCLGWLCGLPQRPLWRAAVPLQFGMSPHPPRDHMPVG